MATGAARLGTSHVQRESNRGPRALPAHVIASFTPRRQAAPPITSYVPTCLPLSKATGAQILAMDKSRRESLYADFRAHKDLSKALRDAGLRSTLKVSIVDQAIKMVDRVTREAGQLHDQVLKAESLSALPENQRASIAYLADFFDQWQSKLQGSEAAKC